MKEVYKILYCQIEKDSDRFKHDSEFQMLTEDFETESQAVAYMKENTQPNHIYNTYFKVSKFYNN